ncbi:MAG TPA: histidine kinase [Streptosporangiaceae bacterium]|nr:histidine kinase [Streptosporangiaceae bacterium]
MFRSLTTRMDPVAGARSVTAARVIDTVRSAGVVVVTITVSLARPGPATAGPRGTAIAVLLGVSAAAWIAWILSDGRDRLNAASLVVMGAAGGVLTGLTPNSPAVAVGCVAVFSAGARLSTMGLWTVALTRNEFLVRAVSAERTLVETRRAREAETQAAALAERARIARDLHDVLAHSLAAVSVNLQAAEGLLTSGTLPEDNPELVTAIECIDRAGNLTRDGLVAAKRAVLALRDDAAPLPDQLASLAGQFRTADDPALTLEVSGEAPPGPRSAGPCWPPPPARPCWTPRCSSGSCWPPPARPRRSPTRTTTRTS